MFVTRKFCLLMSNHSYVLARSTMTDFTQGHDANIWQHGALADFNIGSYGRKLLFVFFSKGYSFWGKLYKEENCSPWNFLFQRVNSKFVRERRFTCKETAPFFRVMALCEVDHGSLHTLVFLYWTFFLYLLWDLILHYMNNFPWYSYNWLWITSIQLVFLLNCLLPL